MDHMETVWVECPRCGGLGFLCGEDEIPTQDDACLECGGSGRVAETVYWTTDEEAPDGGPD